MVQMADGYPRRHVSRKLLLGSLLIVAVSLVCGRAITTAILTQPLDGVGFLFGLIGLRIHGRRLATATRHTLVTVGPHGSVQ
jgi:hypothetical protein